MTTIRLAVEGEADVTVTVNEPELVAFRRLLIDMVKYPINSVPNRLTWNGTRVEPIPTVASGPGYPGPAFDCPACRMRWWLPILRDQDGRWAFRCAQCGKATATRNDQSLVGWDVATS